MDRNYRRQPQGREKFVPDESLQPRHRRENADGPLTTPTAGPKKRGLHGKIAVSKKEERTWQAPVPCVHFFIDSSSVTDRFQLEK